jgi:LPXTG-site transpeptidase (sortase) family protein
MRVKVDELGIDLPLVEGDGWTVPLYKAAHYPGMKVPGEGQRSLLYAHAQAGMFAPLTLGAPGQHVEVSRPGKPTLYYVITEYYAKWPPSDLKWTQAGDHEQVVLLTCTTYSANDPRIIAVADPDPSHTG